MKTKNLSPEELKQVQLLQEEKNQDLLKRFILDQTEAKVERQFSDEKLDQELEKRKLLNTIDDLWRIKEVDGKLLKEPSNYKAIFNQEFYKEIYRLNGWKYEGTIAQKPWKVGIYTNEIIYYRFSHEVLPFLRIVNPFIIPGRRKYKHHQYLTPGARIELSRFISQAVEMMKECSGWNEFRIKYCSKYNVPYQLKMFP